MIIENIIIHQIFLLLDKPSQTSSMGMFKVSLSLWIAVSNGRWMHANPQIDCHENGHDNKLHFQRLGNGSFLVSRLWVSKTFWLHYEYSDFG